MFLPVDILWIWGVADSPVLSAELGAEHRAPWLPTTVTALAFTGIKVLKDSEKTHHT